MTVGHTHNFDHLTILLTGSVHVKAVAPDGRIIEQDFEAPTDFLIKRDFTHEFTALTPHVTYWCIYAHRNPQGNVVQEWNGWTDAYV